MSQCFPPQGTYIWQVAQNSLLSVPFWPTIFGRRNLLDISGEWARKALLGTMPGSMKLVRWKRSIDKREKTTTRIGNVWV